MAIAIPRSPSPTAASAHGHRTVVLSSAFPHAVSLSALARSQLERVPAFRRRSRRQSSLRGTSLPGLVSGHYTRQQTLLLPGGHAPRRWPAVSRSVSSRAPSLARRHMVSFVTSFVAGPPTRGAGARERARADGRAPRGFPGAARRPAPRVLPPARPGGGSSRPRVSSGRGSPRRLQSLLSAPPLGSRESRYPPPRWAPSWATLLGSRYPRPRWAPSWAPPLGSRYPPPRLAPPPLPPPPPPR